MVFIFFTVLVVAIEYGGIGFFNAVFSLSIFLLVLGSSSECESKMLL